MSKLKRSYGKGKSNRKNFRFTEQIKTMLEDAATEMQRSENDIVSDAIFNYLEDKSKFITCPNCSAFIYPKELIQVSGVGEFDCVNCQTHIWYDVEEDKILKATSK